MSKLDRQSAEWCWSLGVSARHHHLPAAKSCVFRDGCDHARWWRMGFEGLPFMWLERS